MKKNILALLPFLLVSFSISGCAKDQASLTYGTYIKSDINSLREITTYELLDKVNQKEVFLLAVYQDKYSDDCLCWNTFKNVIVNYINTYHECVYTYNAHYQSDAIKNLNIEKRQDSDPALYIFNGDKLISKFSYTNNQDKAIFEDTTAEAMKTRVHRKVNKPTMYYVDEGFMEREYSIADQLCVLYYRSGCGDCKYVIPNVIIPYINRHSLKKNLFLFDIQSQYEEAVKEGATNEDKARYQELKDRHGLSEKGNATFGYQNGVVPTIQYVIKGKIDGATVYFNDSISKKEDGTFYLSNSYYSKERLPNLKYLKGYDKYPAVLKDMEIKEGVLTTPSNTYYWSQEVASRYHKPLLEAFFDYYMF